MSRQTCDFQDLLLSQSSMRRFSNGATIIALDEADSDLHFLLHGAVEVSVARPCLDMTTIHVIPSRTWVGEHSAPSRIPSFAAYQARMVTTALTSPHAALVAIQASSPTLAEAFADLLALSLRTQFELAGNLINHSVEQRIRAKLHSLSRLAPPSQPGGGMTIPICQGELAVITCTSRSSVCKVLRELEQRKVIASGYGEIVVLKADEL